MQLNNSFIYILATLTQGKVERLYVEQYCLIQELCRGTGVVAVKVIAGVMDVMDITDIMGHCES